MRFLILIPKREFGGTPSNVKILNTVEYYHYLDAIQELRHRVYKNCGYASDDQRSINRENHDDLQAWHCVAINKKEEVVGCVRMFTDTIHEIVPDDVFRYGGIKLNDNDYVETYTLISQYIDFVSIANFVYVGGMAVDLRYQSQSIGLYLGLGLIQAVTANVSRIVFGLSFPQAGVAGLYRLMCGKYLSDKDYYCNSHRTDVRLVYFDTRTQLKPLIARKLIHVVKPNIMLSTVQ